MSRCGMARRGWTLVELVIVLVVVGILASVTFVVLLEAMRIYAQATPTVTLAYQTQLTSSRLRHDLRDLQAAGTIVTFGPQELVFADAFGQVVDYRLVGDELQRNGRPLAEGVGDLAFRFTSSSGAQAATADEIDLVSANVVFVSDSAKRLVHAAVHPRRRNL